MRKWIPLLIIAAAFIASAIVYPSLPERVPTHWNIAGQPDRWSNREWGAWVIPVHVVLVGVMVLVTLSVLIYSYLEWKREQPPPSAAS